VEECVAQGFAWIWNCFDVPNWLTLTVEIAVAGFLAVLFYHLTKKLGSEQKELAKGQREIGETALLRILFKIIDHTSAIQELYQSALKDGKHQADSKRWKNIIEPALEQDIKLLEEDILKLFSLRLNGEVIALVKIMIIDLKNYSPDLMLANDERGKSIRKNIKEIIKKCTEANINFSMYEKFQSVSEDGDFL